MIIRSIRDAALTGVLCLGALTACTPTEPVSRSTIVVDGREYPLETRVVTQGGRTFEHTVVIVRQRRVTCLPDSPGDCEGAAREARSSSSDDR